MKIELLSHRLYQAGTHDTPEIDIADDGPTEDTRFAISVTRCTDASKQTFDDPALKIEIRIEVQIDGQWLFAGAFECYGGQHVRRDGSVAAESSLSGVLPRGAGRRGRAQFITPAPTRIAVVAELTKVPR